MTPNFPNMTENSTTEKFSQDEISQIKILEIIHLIGNWTSGGILSVLGIVLYLAISSDISPRVRRTAYDIINFNISFVIYFGISIVLCLVIVGFILLPIFGVCWLIFMIIGAIKHFSWENYVYPMSIPFLK